MLHGFILLRSFGAPLEHFRVCRYPNRPWADEVKFREMSREIFERVYLPDEWKPAYNAARRTRSQLHWIDLREHPRSFDELGGVWRTTADRKGYGDTDEEWSRAY